MPATVLVAVESIVESFTEVVLKRTESVDAGHIPPDQLAHSVQLLVDPPPPQVITAACAKEGAKNKTKKAGNNHGGGFRRCCLKPIRVFYHAAPPPPPAAPPALDDAKLALGVGVTVVPATSCCFTVVK